MAIKKIKHVIKVDEGEAKTTFKAELSFKDEITPNQRKEIRKRLACGNFERYWRNTAEMNLEKYLYKKHFKYSKEQGIMEEITYLAHRGGLSQKYKFKPQKRNLGLNISAKIEGEAKLEDMINLEELNTFILTGKY